LRVGAVSIGGAVKLSRRASHHGAIFAIPANDKFVPEVGTVQSRLYEFDKQPKGFVS